MSLTHLDLFSGIGGFALAARWARIETVAFCETDPFCRQVLNKNFPDVPVLKDVREMKGIHTDLMTAGFPCQPFSVAGKQKGKDDDRYLWPEVIRIIRLSRPNWIILENVPGIIPHLDTILKDLEGEAYNWRAFLIPASAVSAPHKRERIWIIAHRNSERCDNGVDNREKRHIQDDWQSNIEKIQSEWTQFQPESWTTFKAQEWLGFATDANSIERNQGATDKEAFPIGFEWQRSSAKTGDAITDTYIATQSFQYNSSDGCKSKRRVEYSGKSGYCEALFNWKKDQPPIPGVDDGLPNGVDRNKALGNAIVPQIAYLLMKLILEVEKV